MRSLCDGSGDRGKKGRSSYFFVVERSLGGRAIASIWKLTPLRQEPAPQSNSTLERLKKECDRYVMEVAIVGIT
jgi:hypothetical protein